MRFYVYEHIRRDTGAVFYVGKGSRRRAYVTQHRSPQWHHISAEHGYSVRIVIGSIDEELAYLVERELIDLRRRTGVELVNVTDGGEAFSMGMWSSPEVRARHSASQQARWSDCGERAAQSARIRSAYSDGGLRQKIGAAVRASLADPDIRKSRNAAIAAARGTDASRALTSEFMRRRMEDPAQRERMRAIGRRHAARVLCIETGQVFEAVADAAAWLRSIGHSKAVDAAVVHVCAGRRKSAYGHTWRYAEAA
jgi:hypothetical protein